MWERNGIMVICFELGRIPSIIGNIDLMMRRALFILKKNLDGYDE